MSSDLSQDFYQANRQRLLSQTKAELIIISASSLVQKSADIAYPFKQDTNFWYLTGIDEPDLVLVLSSSEHYLIIPKLSNYRQVFDGGLNPDELRKASGIDQIYEQQQGWAKLRSQIKSAKTVATLLPNPRRVKVYQFYSQPARRILVNRLKSINPKLSFEDLRPILARMRMIKQPAEIKLIQRAIDITSSTLAELLSYDNLLSYQNSGQLASAISFGFRQRGAQADGFEPVVASGKYSTILHSDALDQPLNQGDLIVVDVGAEYAKYSADISRTVCYGQPSLRQQQAFQAVKDVQQRVFKLIKPGAMIKDLENEVESMLGQHLKDLGVISDLSSKSIRKHYGHAFSHSLGLDLHDSADYSQPLAKDMVITVEPGLYIPEEQIGVRIEDDVLLTDSGIKILSSQLKTALKM